MHSIYIEIYCPNIPKLESLEVCIPELKTCNSQKFELYETVEIVSLIHLYYNLVICSNECINCIPIYIKSLCGIFK